MSDIRVLVVDDELQVCNSCMKTLRSEGYSVDHALNGEEALNRLAAGSFDLVVTDLKMPRVDGMQLLKAVKERWPEVNVIMITGYGTIRSAVEAIKLGAFDYLSKPFTSEELAGVVARALGMTDAHRRGEADGFCIPSDLSDLRGDDLERMWCIPEHAWIREQDDGTAIVGLDAIYRRLLQADIDAIELAPVARRITQGDSCAVMTVVRSRSGKATEEVRHNLWCPVTGTVVEHNQAVLQDLSLLRKSPYARGWLLRVEVSNLEEDREMLKPFLKTIAGRVASRHVAAPVPA